ncbi:MAG: ABC transporter permease [Alphaproteobacteria bacterium]
MTHSSAAQPGRDGPLARIIAAATDTTRLQLLLLQLSPVILFAIVLVVFSQGSDRFLTIQTLNNVIIQSAHIAIIAIGMTFVLLTAGIDLSVGAIMYVVVVIVTLYLGDLPLAVSFPIGIVVGVIFGCINGFFIVVARVAPFIATLATLFIGRGIALFMTKTAMVFANDDVLTLGRTDWLGIRSSIWAFVFVFVIAFFVLRSTPFGRQVYAVGQDASAAAKAGLKVSVILFSVYAISGATAALGGLVSITQVAAASSTFGFQKEFSVIAAAVLGGTSLFGGRGTIIGTAFGALLIQTVETGLVMSNTNPYAGPLVTAGIIFLAVMVDAFRTHTVARLNRRKIRIDDPPDRGS